MSKKTNLKLNSKADHRWNGVDHYKASNGCVCSIYTAVKWFDQ